MSTPLVVNTLDGTVWTRRAVTPGGLALYAMAGACGCPEFVMATLPELAEHGIAGSAFALPMPVGTEPLELSEQQVGALAAAGNRVVNDEMHEHLCMCDAWPEKCVSTGNYSMGAWDVSGLETALPAVLALWEQMRGGELERLRARVAELEAVVSAALAGHQKYADSGHCQHDGAVWPCPTVATLAPTRQSPAEESADRLTALLAPTQALREEPHDGPLHHDYLIGRDLPETGGVR